jgi:VCBS repeat-containing protein
VNCGLPTTGIDIWPYIAIGLLLLLGGVIAIAVARRSKAPIIAAIAIALLAVGGLTLAPAQSALAAGGCPVAVPDVNSVTVDTAPNPVTGNVLTNDTDPGGFALTVTNPGGAIAMTYGQLTLAADGSYSYELDNADPTVNDLQLGHSLTDVFTYDISDGHGGTASTTLTITIHGSNRPPVANPDVNSINADATPATVTGNTLTNDTDPDSNTLTVTTTANMVGSYGSLVILSDGDYTYTLNEGDPTVSGLLIGATLTDTFHYSISDGHGGTASSTVTITINGTFENIQ